MGEANGTGTDGAGTDRDDPSIQPLEVGDRAPDFELKGAYDGEIGTYVLSDMRAEGAVLIGVYPMDFHEICTRQMCQLSDMDWYQYKTDLTIVGVNTHGPWSHMRFAEEEGIEYPLLCDTGGSMLEAYGVLEPEVDGFERVPRRSMFLVGSDGTVRYRWIAEDNFEQSDFGINPVEKAIQSL